MQGRMRYVIEVEPFAMGDEKAQALKPLEEAAEAFGTWQAADRDEGSLSAIWYECADVIQAACNLMYDTCAMPEDVRRAMAAVREANEERGRYA